MTPITVSVCQEAVREVSASKEEDKGEQTCEGKKYSNMQEGIGFNDKEHVVNDSNI